MAINKQCAKGAFTPRKSASGVGKFEKYYYNIEIKKVLKKVGEGEDDYVLVNKKIVHKDLIQGVIDSQADEVGVYNIIERAIRTGDNSLLQASQVHVSDEILDITGAPKDLAEGLHMSQASEAAFAALDPALTKGRTLEQFILSITADEFAQWQASLLKTDKTEKKEDKE